MNCLRTKTLTSLSLMTMIVGALALLLALPIAASASCVGKTRDKDGDGLTNCVERKITGTHKGRVDSDHDGLSDGVEVDNGMDPLTPDSDNDGISDGDEVLDGTDPENADTDSDGVTDLHDHDPCGDLHTKIEAAIDAVHLDTQTLVIIGIDVDVSGARFEQVAGLADLSAGLQTEVKLDPAALDAGRYEALVVRAKDRDADGIPDDRDTDRDNDGISDDLDLDDDNDGILDTDDNDDDDDGVSDADDDNHQVDVDGDGCIETETSIHLDNVGPVTAAYGKAEYGREHCFEKFEVEVKNLPVGAYDLSVAGVIQGVIMVRQHRSSTKGKIKFGDDPREHANAPLDFEPAGVLVEVSQDGTVILSRILP